MSEEIPAAAPAAEAPVIDGQTQSIMEGDVVAPAGETISDGLAAIADEIDGAVANESEEVALDEAAPDAEEIKELKKMLKLKVNGEEVDQEIDFNDTESLTREFQKAKAFDQTSREYAELKKQAGSLIQQLKEDPFAVLSELGLNPDDLAEARIQKQIEELQKSPEQLEKEKMEEELSALRKDKESAEKDKQEYEMNRLRDHYATEIENEISGALDSSATTLPRSPLVIKRIAETMYLGIENGMDLSASDVIPLVEQQFKQELSEMFGKLPEDLIEQVVGKSNMDRVRKKRISGRKSAQTAKNIVKDTGNVAKEEGEAKSVSYKDFFNLRS